MNIEIEEFDILLFCLKTKENFKLQKIDTLTRRYVLARKNIIVETKEELENLIMKTFDSNKNINICLGVIPYNLIKQIEEKTKNVKCNKIIELLEKSDKYTLTVSQNEINHMKKDSLTEEDILNFIKRIDIIITEFDEVSYSIYNNTQNALRFKKKINGITFIAVIVISNQYHTFRVQTIYIEKNDFLKIYSKKSK